MATTKKAPAEGQRRCIGSERYRIKAHDAPIADFPAQPSQKDGLGRMCKIHWNQYTAGLARDRKAKAADGTEPTIFSKKAATKGAGGTSAELRTKVRAAAKPPKKPESIRTKPPRSPRQKSSGERIAESMAEATRNAG